MRRIALLLVAGCAAGSPMPSDASRDDGSSGDAQSERMTPPVLSAPDAAPPPRIVLDCVDVQSSDPGTPGICGAGVALRYCPDGGAPPGDCAERDYPAEDGGILVVWCCH